MTLGAVDSKDAAGARGRGGSQQPADATQPADASQAAAVWEPAAGSSRPPHSREGTEGRPLDADAVALLRFDEQGLVPVVAQDEVTGQVLMLAWANQEALRASLASGWMTYWSRSRGGLWEKGATSGNRQRLVALRADCDDDAVLATVMQDGPACHTGTAGCWSGADAEPAGWLGALDRLARQRLEAPEGRYTDALLRDPALAAAKVEEEAAEVGCVLRGQDNEDTLEHEAADLLYHLVIALRAGGVSLEGALRELRRRHK